MYYLAEGLSSSKIGHPLVSVLVVLFVELQFGGRGIASVIDRLKAIPRQYIRNVSV